MKFELEPDNRGADDDTLLSDLRAVAVFLGKNFVTKLEYDKHGRWSASALEGRFGSWSGAHQRAGLRIVRHFGATVEDCVKELDRVAKNLGTTTLSERQYRSHGRISVDTICSRCGSWSAALARVGLASCHPFTKGVPMDELFQNLAHVWELLGRQPRRDDLVKPLSTFSWQVYNRQFGSFRKALEAFVTLYEGEETERPAEEREERIEGTTPVCVAKRHRTSRTISDRTRFRVMRRDNFKCCICGAIPALKPGTDLEVDHIVPWAAGGETVMENLQTLCERCNSGKSNLRMQAD